METKENILEKLPQAVLSWYDQGHRELPWRQDQDAYHIWLSEIMLQQTRVEAAKGYYARFLQALPTVQDLAEADDELLHKLWEGLGYYSRVRNLKKAAQVIVKEYGGVFPGEYEKVLALPGVGAYTAGAICSIAFGQKTPAVDGNVLRVYCRLTLDETPVETPNLKKQVTMELQRIYPNRTGDFTQALMELGATVCGPNRRPDCENCPCRAFCLAHGNDKANALPVRLPKKERRVEEKTVFILSCDGKIAIRKRPDSGLLAGLWEFPHTPGILESKEALEVLDKMGIKAENLEKYVERKHIFTHIQWNMRAFYITVKKPFRELTWMPLSQIRSDAALPTAFRQFLQD